MPLALADRVRETTTTSGTGSITLLGAVAGYQSFAIVGNGNTCYYTITDGSAWEVGIGTYSTSGPTLARTIVLSNSNANTSPITLSSGATPKDVFLTYPSEKAVALDSSSAAGSYGQNLVSTGYGGLWQDPLYGITGINFTTLYGGTATTSAWNPVSINCGGAT